MLQCAAFFAFGLGFLLIPVLLLEGIYQVDDVGEVGWIRLLGAALIGVGAMEAALVQDLDRYRPLASSFIAVPALLSVAFIWILIEGTELFNAFFGWSSLGVTLLFTLGHLWFRRSTEPSPALA